MPTGSCLCGAVDFEVAGELPAPDACHCSQCRRQSGHYWASTDVARDALTIRGSQHLSWFRSSERVRRGFCSVCGSVLFWDPIERGTIAVAMGASLRPPGPASPSIFSPPTRGTITISPTACRNTSARVRPPTIAGIGCGP